MKKVAIYFGLVILTIFYGCTDKVIEIFTANSPVYLSYEDLRKSVSQEDAKELVSSGDLGYWPQGQALCIFFGPTPISKVNEIRPASAVTVFGKVVGDVSILKRITSGTEIIIERK